MAAKLTASQFRTQLGPFVLVQQPPHVEVSVPQTQVMGALPMNVQRTTVSRPDNVSANALGLLFQFEELVVATVPPLKGLDELTVGRQPDSDLVLDDSSVSKRHALLRWDALHQRCTVKDLGSTNGTFLNVSTRLRSEVTLHSGDILSFGDVQYWFLLTDTLHERLRKKNTSKAYT
mgnify:CR=1 FL=1